MARGEIEMPESSSDEEDSELLNESKEQVEVEEAGEHAEAVEDEEPEEVVGMVLFESILCRLKMETPLAALPASISIGTSSPSTL